MSKDTLPKILQVKDLTHNSEAKKKADQLISFAIPAGESKTIEAALRRIKVKKIRSLPIIYGIFDINYVNVDIKEKEVPYEKGRKSAEFRIKPEDFKKFLFDKNGSEVFNSFIRRNISKMGLSKSYYSFECDKCKTTGKMKCTCKNGMESCYSCRGTGTAKCDECEGDGAFNCWYCSGSGRVQEYSIVTDNYEYVPCSNCGGKGRFECETCKGSGSIICPTCYGRRTKTCRLCGGTKIAKCSGCKGVGYRATELFLEKNISDYSIPYSIIKGEEFKTRYPYEIKWKTSKDDQFICHSEGSEALTCITCKEFKGYQLDVSKQMNWTIDYFQKEKGGQITGYSCDVYRKDYLEIEFVLDEKTYYILHNILSNTVVLSEDPLVPLYDIVKEKYDAAIAKNSMFGRKATEKEYNAFLTACGKNK